jgi:RHS repeat-associated protein
VHSAAGNLETRTDGTKTLGITYDELGNLTQAVQREGTSTILKTITYIIDGMGRRVGRQVNGTFDKKWLYRDGLRPVAEVDSAGVFTHFVYADSQSGAPDFLIRSGVLYRIIKDHLGSVRLVVNASTGAIAQSLEYDAFGRVLSETGSGFQPFGFAGGLYDADTKLVRFGARDYDPGMGRWTNKDPIGFAGGDTNVYAYAGNDPVNTVDPNGLESFMCTKPLSALDFIALRLDGGTRQVNNTRSGPDISGNLLYHQYICVSRSGEKDVCGGQSGGGHWKGPGQPSTDHYALYRCERVHDDNECLDKCLAVAINDKKRPYYNLFGVMGTNCQEWADDTMARCEQKCGVN